MTIPATTTKRPAHPGDVLFREHMRRYNLTSEDVASQAGLSEDYVLDVIQGKKPLSIDAALRLSMLFPDTTFEYWCAIQRAVQENRMDYYHSQVTPLPATR